MLINCIIALKLDTITKIKQSVHLLEINLLKTLNTAQLAIKLGVDATTVRRKINNGDIQSLNKGKKAILTPVSLEYYNFHNEHKISLENMKRKAKVISFVNHKGGCSKTTSAYTICALLQNFGNKVLLVDLDPQGNSTTSVLNPLVNKDGITLPFPKTIKNLLLDRKKKDSRSNSKK